MPASLPAFARALVYVGCGGVLRRGSSVWLTLDVGFELMLYTSLAVLPFSLRA